MAHDAPTDPDATDPLPTAPLIAVADLARVARETIDPNDPWAMWIVDAVSVLVRAAGDPYWTEANVPATVRIVALLVAKRTWLNPDGEVRTNVGPLGSSVREIEAMGMRLHPDEIAEIHAALSPTAAGSSGLWILPTNRGPLETPVYLADNSGSDWHLQYATPEESIFYTPRVY